MIDLRGVGEFESIIVSLSEDEPSRQIETKNCSIGYQILEAISKRKDLVTKSRTYPLSRIKSVIGIETIATNKVLIIAQTEEQLLTNDTVDDSAFIMQDGPPVYREPQQAPRNSGTPLVDPVIVTSET